MVDQATGRGHDHIALALEVIPLFAIAHATVNERDLGVHEAHVVAKSRFHLHGEFACRLQNQAANAWLGMVEHGEHRQSKGRRFSGAGLSGGNQIASGENQRGRPQLNGRGLGIAHALGPMENGFGKA